MAITNQAVLRVLKAREGKTANAIAKELGLNKANQALKDILEELEEDEQLHVDYNGRYSLYFKGPEPEEGDDEDEEGEDREYELTHEDDLDIPEDTMGFEIAKSRGGGFVITSPKGRRYELEAGERLLIINPGKTNEKPYAVRTAERAFDAITDYVTNVESIVNYVVQDIRTSKYIDARKKDIDMSTAIIFVSVRAHNKAGK